jgi:hypothetical protein
MDRQARTRDTVLVKSREMTGRSHTLPWWLEAAGVKTTENKIPWPRWLPSSLTHYELKITINRPNILGSIVDPYVFGYPGSGSVIICTDPDPVLVRILPSTGKKVRKPKFLLFFFTYFCIFIFEDLCNCTF